MNTSTLKIAIEVDDKGSVKIRELGNEAKNAGEKGEKSMGGFRGKIDELKGSTDLSVASLTKIGAMGFAAATAGLAALTAGMVSTLGAASDLAETQGKFNVVFAGQLGQAEQWSKELVAGYAMSTEESKRYLAAMQDLLVPMGMMPDAAARMSNEVVRLSADLGSFNNLPTEQVMDDIQSALVGNYETMKKYGVVISAATVEQKALTMGLAASKEELTAGEKAQAAYQMMVEGSAAAIGDMARTSDDYANQMKSFHAITQDLTAAMGKQLLPIAADVLGKINSGMRDNAGSVENLATILTTKLLQGLDGVLTGVEYLHVGWKMLETVIPVVANAMVQATTMMFAGLRKLLFPLDGIFIAMEKTADFMGKEFINPLDTIQKKMDEMGNVTQGVMEETFQDIIDVQGQYDKLHGTIGGYIDQVKNSAKEEATAATKIQDVHAATGKAIVTIADNTAAAISTNRKKSLTDLEKQQKEYLDNEVKMATAAAKNITDSWLVSAQLRGKAEEDLEKEQNRILSERERLEAETSDEIKRLTLSDTDYKIAKFEEQYQAAVDLAGDDKELQDELTKYHKLKLDEISGHSSETLLQMFSHWEDFSDNVGDELGKFTKDLVTGQFDSIGDAWEGLWKGMVGTASQYLGNIVAQFAAAKIADFVTDVFFHSGSWRVEQDETRAVILKDEMVIPPEESKIIRQAFPNGDFAGLAASVSGKTYGSTAGIDKAAISTAIQAGLMAAMGLSIDTAALGASFSQRASAETFSGVIGDMLGISTETGPFGGSSYGTAGRTLGSATGIAAFGGVIGTALSSLTGYVGSMLGDIMGDTLDDRSYESLRDAMEAGILDPAEAIGFAREADRMGIDNSSRLGGFFDGIGSAINNAKASAVQGIKDLGRALGFGLSDGSYGGGDGFGSDAAGFGGNADGGGNMGRGGYGDHGDMGMDNDGYAHTGGYLLKADEGRMIVQTDEGVLSRTGMKNLHKLNTGDFSDDESVLRYLGATQKLIADQLQDIKRLVASLESKASLAAARV